MTIQPSKHTTPKASDQSLWERVRGGDREAFECLYNKYFDQLYRYGMTIKPQPDLVGDAVQEVFVDLWLYRKNLSQINRFKNYLFASLRTRIYNLISKNNKVLNSEKEYVLQVIQFMDSAEDKLISTDQKRGNRDKMILLINELPGNQREAIMLIFFENRSYEEASSLMSKNIQNIYTLVSRGISALRKKIQRRSR